MAISKSHQITRRVYARLLKDSKFLRIYISKLKAAIKKSEEELSGKKKCLEVAIAQLRRLEENEK